MNNNLEAQFVITQYKQRVDELQHQALMAQSFVAQFSKQLEDGTARENDLTTKVAELQKEVDDLNAQLDDMKRRYEPQQ